MLATCITKAAIQYKFHLAHYGNPKDYGFKDLIHEWKAENWDPEKLVKLYKDCGAEYFVAMANHHDNLDMWNSTYQEWNTVKVGPPERYSGWMVPGGQEEQTALRYQHPCLACLDLV